ncbi:hypothetical protein CU098_010053, partial [Rhizopus stolonifer]
MEGVLGLQIIERTVTFYVLVLPNIGLYTMRELAKEKSSDGHVSRFACDQRLYLDMYSIGRSVKAHQISPNNNHEYLEFSLLLISGSQTVVSIEL